MDNAIIKLLEAHLIDVNRITHFVNDGDYWHVFNDTTMTGFEINGNPNDLYTIECWSTTEFYIDLALNGATKL